MRYVYKIIDSPVGKLKLVAKDSKLAAILWERDCPNRVRLGPAAYSDENSHLFHSQTGHLFQFQTHHLFQSQTGHLFQSQTGHLFQSKPATCSPPAALAT